MPLYKFNPTSLVSASTVNGILSFENEGANIYVSKHFYASKHTPTQSVLIDFFMYSLERGPLMPGVEYHVYAASIWDGKVVSILDIIHKLGGKDEGDVWLSLDHPIVGEAQAIWDLCVEKVL